MMQIPIKFQSQEITTELIIEWTRSIKMTTNQTTWSRKIAEVTWCVLHLPPGRLRNSEEDKDPSKECDGRGKVQVVPGSYVTVQ